MEERDEKIRLLLESIFYESPEIPDLYENPHYHHLLQSGVSWAEIYSVIDEYFTADGRLYLRGIEEQFIFDYAGQELAKLNLHVRHKVSELNRAAWLLGLIAAPHSTWKNFQMGTDDLAELVKVRLWRNGIQTSPAVLESSSGNPDSIMTLREEYAVLAIEAINSVIYETMGLNGNDAAFSNPDSHSLQALLLGKFYGTPLSLSVLYLILAQKNNLPVYGVNMPRHFLIKWESSDTEFFINPFNNGVVVPRQDLYKQLYEQNYPIHQQFFEPCYYDTMVKRNIANLTILYRTRGDDRKVSLLDSLARNIPV